MNVNMNLNNLTDIQVNNNLMGGIKQSANADNGEFLNMLNMLMTKNSAASTASSQNGNNTNDNVLGLLLGNNLSSLVNLADTYVLSNEDINFFKGSAKEEKPKSKYNNSSCEELIGFIDGFNFMNTNIINSEIAVNSTVSNAKNAEYAKAIMRFGKTCENQNAKITETDKQQNIMNESINKEESPVLENSVKILSDTSQSAEKFITDAESNRDKFKEEIDFHAEVTEDIGLTFQGNNKIIKVSDESSEIKASVLTQVKDKIVFMADEGIEGKSGTKHVTMELNPENLGKVNVKMTFENGKLTVEIKALNETTQKILFSNSDDLARILNKATNTNVNVIIKSNESKYDQNPLDYNQNNQNKRQRNSFFFNEETKNSEEDSMFSEIINLRNLKLNAV